MSSPVTADVEMFNTSYTEFDSPSLAENAVRASNPQALEGLRSAMRSIALADPERRFSVWENCVSDMSRAVRKGHLAEGEFVEAFSEIASNHNFDADTVQQLLGKSLLENDRQAKDAQPAEANGKQRALPKAWWRDPATIPPRKSLYDGHYIRRAIGARSAAVAEPRRRAAFMEAISMSAGFDIATKSALSGTANCGFGFAMAKRTKTNSIVALPQPVSVTASPRRTSAAGLFVQSVRDNPLRIASLVAIGR